MKFHTTFPLSKLEILLPLFLCLFLNGNLLGQTTDSKIKDLHSEDITNRLVEIDLDLLEGDGFLIAGTIPLNDKGEEKSKSLSSARSPLFANISAAMFNPVNFNLKGGLQNWVKELKKYVKYSVAYFFEYNDNIFLRPNDLESDNIHTVEQEIKLEYPTENWFIEARFKSELPYYQHQDELIPTYEAEGRLTYNPFDKLSLGVSNRFLKIEDSEVATSLGDQVLSLGLITNTVGVSSKYEVWHNGFLQAGYTFDTIDFDRDRFDFFIDRNVHDLDFRIRQICSPEWSGYLGYRYRDVAFNQFEIKDSESHIFFGGFEYKIHGLMNFFGEVGYEDRDFVNHNDVLGTFLGVPIQGTSQSNEGNFNYRVGFETTFSRFNQIAVFYDDHLYESSRSEFTIFRGKTIGVAMKQHLLQDTILFLSFTSQLQEFDSEDNIVNLFGGGDADTDIYFYSATIRQILNEWLHCDLSYSYSQRNTDFLGEDSENHRFRAGIIASF